MKERKTKTTGRRGTRTSPDEADSWPASELKDIHQRAYKTFLARGSVAGQELEGWLQTADKLKHKTGNPERPRILT